jgi:hypothetical protein
MARMAQPAETTSAKPPPWMKRDLMTATPNFEINCKNAAYRGKQCPGLLTSLAAQSMA